MRNLADACNPSVREIREKANVVVLVRSFRESPDGVGKGSGEGEGGAGGKVGRAGQQRLGGRWRLASENELL